MDRAGVLVQGLQARQLVQGAADRGGAGRRMVPQPPGRARHGGQVLDAADAATGAPAHGAPPGEQGVEAGGGQVDHQAQAAGIVLDLRAAYVVARLDDAFRQAEPDREVLQVCRRHHHHGVGYGAIDDVDRHFGRHGTDACLGAQPVQPFLRHLDRNGRRPWARAGGGDAVQMGGHVNGLLLDRCPSA